MLLFIFDIAKNKSNRKRAREILRVSVFLKNIFLSEKLFFRILDNISIQFNLVIVHLITTNAILESLRIYEFTLASLLMEYI